MAKKGNGWCAPLIIYMVLSVFSLMMILSSNKKNKMNSFVMNLVFMAMIGAIMYYLCKSGHAFWSWIILLLPLILWVLLLIMAMLGIVGNSM